MGWMDGWMEGRRGGASGSEEERCSAGIDIGSC